jgi:hypothetical protein
VRRPCCSYRRCLPTRRTDKTTWTREIPTNPVSSQDQRTCSTFCAINEKATRVSISQRHEQGKREIRGVSYQIESLRQPHPFNVCKHFLHTAHSQGAHPHLHAAGGESADKGPFIRWLLRAALSQVRCRCGWSLQWSSMCGCVRARASTLLFHASHSTAARLQRERRA